MNCQLENIKLVLLFYIPKILSPFCMGRPAVRQVVKMFKQFSLGVSLATHEIFTKQKAVQPFITDTVQM